MFTYNFLYMLSYMVIITQLYTFNIDTLDQIVKTSSIRQHCPACSYSCWKRVPNGSRFMCSSPEGGVSVVGCLQLYP